MGNDHLKGNENQKETSTILLVVVRGAIETPAQTC